MLQSQMRSSGMIGDRDLVVVLGHGFVEQEEGRRTRRRTRRRALTRSEDTLRREELTIEELKLTYQVPGSLRKNDLRNNDLRKNDLRNNDLRNNDLRNNDSVNDSVVDLQKRKLAGSGVLLNVDFRIVIEADSNEEREDKAAAIVSALAAIGGDASVSSGSASDATTVGDYTQGSFGNGTAGSMSALSSSSGVVDGSALVLPNDGSGSSSNGNAN
jgi:hypothetical protein